MEDIRQFSEKTMWEATVSCDQAYDDKFFYAVETTGIFCRPSCKSKTPKFENVHFFSSAELAEKSGYRACKRCRPDLETGSQQPNESIIKETIRFLENHSEENLLLDEIALGVGVSPFHLTRMFKKDTGYTPHSYLEKIRIEQAKQLLLTTALSSIDIGFKVGFQSTSSFYNAFKRKTNLSPNKFRVYLKNTMK